MIQYKNANGDNAINPRYVEAIGPVKLYVDPASVEVSYHFPVSVAGAVHFIHSPTRAEAIAERSRVVAEVDRTNKVVKG